MMPVARTMKTADKKKWNVEGGDTLSGIAAMVEVPMGYLKAWNNIVDENKIEAGKELWIVRPPDSVFAAYKPPLPPSAEQRVKQAQEHQKAAKAVKVPDGMSAKEKRSVLREEMGQDKRFGECVMRVLRHEGGAVDDPADPGGRTNYGISQFIFRRMVKDDMTDKRDVWNITKTEAMLAYWLYFWCPLGCKQMSIGADYFIFDSAIQHGEAVARAFLNRCRDNIDFLRDERERFYQGLVERRRESYKEDNPQALGHDIEKYARYYETGWLNRLKEVYAAALDDADAPL